MPDQLTTLRKQIDETDKEIVTLIAQRMSIVKQVSKYKKKNKVPMLDTNRWLKVMVTKKQLAKKLGVNEKLIEDIYDRIHRESLEIGK